MTIRRNIPHWCFCGTFDCDLHPMSTNPQCLHVLESGYTPSKEGRIYMTIALCEVSPLPRQTQRAQWWWARLSSPTKAQALERVAYSWTQEKHVCDDCESIRVIAAANGLAPLKDTSDVNALFALIGEESEREERNARILHPS
jgi:hypothetical protein